MKILKKFEIQANIWRCKTKPLYSFLTGTFKTPLCLVKICQESLLFVQESHQTSKYIGCEEKATREVERGEKATL